MIEAKPGVPPAIALLLNEKLLLLDYSGARKKLRGMIREVQEQTLGSFSEDTIKFVKPAENPLLFRVFVDGGLDLFGYTGACMLPRCRVAYASRIARTLALLADEVWLTDFISEKFLDIGRVTNNKLDRLLSDVMVLNQLEPLIRAGVVRFRSPLRAMCTGCLTKFDAEVSDLSALVHAELRQGLALERRGDGKVVIHTGSMYEPPIVMHSTDPDHQGSEASVFHSIVRQAVRSSLWTANEAAHAGAAVFSNSKAGVAGIRAGEGEQFSMASLAALANERAAELPWVDGLTIQQTLQLRSEAASALPRLREFLAKHLSARPEVDIRTPPTPRTYLYELREQAAEVRSELQTVTSGSRSLTRNSLGVLGLGIFSYGFATGAMEPTAGLFQLLTTLGLLHQLGTPEAHRAAELRSKPGYVLVAAQDILAHAAPDT